jgi:hypothetical protein
MPNERGFWITIAVFTLVVGMLAGSQYEEWREAKFGESCRSAGGTYGCRDVPITSSGRVEIMQSCTCVGDVRVQGGE